MLCMPLTGLAVPENSRSRVLGTLAFSATGDRNNAELGVALAENAPSHLMGASSTGFVAAAPELPLPPAPPLPVDSDARSAFSCATEQSCVWNAARNEIAAVVAWAVEASVNGTDDGNAWQTANMLLQW